MENHSDVIQKAKNGDKNAFEILYKTYYQRIYRYCSINSKRSDIADDITQETFIRAWKALPSFTQTESGTFQAYLYRIARNILIDISRKQKEISLESTPEVAVEQNIIEKIEKADKLARIKQALKKLTEIDRNIIIFRYFEDLSHKECAAILDVQEGALRVRATRAVQKIKDILGIYE